MVAYSRRRLLLRYALGKLINGDNSDGTTGIGGIETVSEKNYNPSLQVPGTTVNYVNENGSPKVTKDSNGKITHFEYTNTAEFSKDSTSMNTGILPFDGSDFTLHLKAVFLEIGMTITLVPLKVIFQQYYQRCVNRAKIIIKDFLFVMKDCGF